MFFPLAIFLSLSLSLSLYLSLSLSLHRLSALKIPEGAQLLIVGV